MFYAPVNDLENTAGSTESLPAFETTGIIESILFGWTLVSEAATGEWSKQDGVACDSLSSLNFQSSTIEDSAQIWTVMSHCHTVQQVPHIYTENSLLAAE